MTFSASSAYQLTAFRMAFFSVAERLRNSLTQLQALQAELLETVAMLRDFACRYAP